MKQQTARYQHRKGLTRHSTLEAKGLCKVEAPQKTTLNSSLHLQDTLHRRSSSSETVVGSEGNLSVLGGYSSSWPSMR